MTVMPLACDLQLMDDQINVSRVWRLCQRRMKTVLIVHDERSRCLIWSLYRYKGGTGSCGFPADSTTKHVPILSSEVQLECKLSSRSHSNRPSCNRAITSSREELFSLNPEVFPRKPGCDKCPFLLRYSCVCLEMLLSAFINLIAWTVQFEHWDRKHTLKGQIWRRKRGVQCSVTWNTLSSVTNSVSELMRRQDS